MNNYKRIISHLKNQELSAILVDCDGDMEALIPLWIEAGVTCPWPLEQASGMDPVRLRKKFGKELILCGVIDKMEIAKGKQAIEKELYKKSPIIRTGRIHPIY